MDFLRNIATAALQSTGVTFPFTIGDKIPGLSSNSSLWDIREGVKKDDGTLLTLFIFDSSLPPLQPGNRDRKALLHLAKNALKKLRTIRHPDVLKYVDSVETETTVYIATERVKPLEAVLSDWDEGRVILGDCLSDDNNSPKKKAKEEWIAWGVKSLGTALSFLNSAPLSQHHSLLIPSSVFITPALEWRLGGFELLTGKDDPTGVLWGMAGLMPGNVGERCAPEVQKGGWGVLRDNDPALSDTYLFATLLFTLFNPTLPLPNLTTAPQPSSTGSLPRSLFPIYKRMLNPNARTRLPTTQFIDEVSRTPFWSGNALLELVSGLDGFQLASEPDKLALLRRIRENATTIPPPFLTSKILPSLLHSLSLPGAPASAILPLVLSIGRNVPPDRYKTIILEPVSKLFASPDRGTRMALLDGLPEYGEKLDKSMVNDKIWPNLITGFADTVAVIREATVKAVPILAPKLSDRLLNNELLRLLAKMQVDPEPSIRTNTCILLGRIAPLLGPHTQKKVLVPAFARSLKDGFVHARVAGLMALMATVEYYDKEDLAGRVIPNMSFTLVDKEKLVRDQGFKAMQMFISRLEAAAAEMPETVLVEGAQQHGPVTTTAPTSNGQANQAGLVNSATGAAGALAGWAIASLGKQLPMGDAHTMLSAASAAHTMLSASTAAQSPSQATQRLAVPQMSGTVNSLPNGSTPRSSTSPAPSNVRSSFGDVSKPKSAAPSRHAGGMKLGMKIQTNPQSQTSSLVDILAGEFEDDADEDEVANAWGVDDLIDVNADEDDWSGFEAAPTPMEVLPKVATSKPPKASTPAPAPTSSKAPIRTSSERVSRPSTSSSSSRVTEHSNMPEMDDPWSNSGPNGRSGVTSPPIASGWTNDAHWEEIPPQRAESPSTTPNVSLSGLSKEDKEKEMARRREERKARIAAMKGAKK